MGNIHRISLVQPVGIVGFENGQYLLGIVGAAGSTLVGIESVRIERKI